MASYWYQDPTVLLHPPYRIFPSPEMTLPQRANAFALLILIITLILFLVGYKGWWLFLLFGLVVALAIAIIEKARASRALTGNLPTDIVEHYKCPRPTRYRGYRK
jgi:uncharacterized membrane protein